MLELAECYIHQLCECNKLPDEIKTIINDPLKRCPTMNANKYCIIEELLAGCLQQIKMLMQKTNFPFLLHLMMMNRVMRKLMV